MANQAVTPVLFSASRPPDDPNDLPAYLFRELARIEQAFNILKAGRLEVSYVAPPKPRAGDIRYAAGAPYWNPGSGEGVYRYSLGGAWVFLG
jgi:hypothetical protein